MTHYRIMNFQCNQLWQTWHQLMCTKKFSHYLKSQLKLLKHMNQYLYISNIKILWWVTKDYICKLELSDITIFVIYCETKNYQYCDTYHYNFDTLSIKFFGDFRGGSETIHYTNTEANLWIFWTSSIYLYGRINLCYQVPTYII